MVGLVAKSGIGVVAAVMGVAGGELLIPTIVLLYGIDIKLAGSLSLAVSLPTMLVAFARYRRDQAFTVLRGNRGFLLAMTIGSVTGALLFGVVRGACIVITAGVIGCDLFGLRGRPCQRDAGSERDPYDGPSLDLFLGELNALDGEADRDRARASFEFSQRSATHDGP